MDTAWVTSKEDPEGVRSRPGAMKTTRVQGIGGTTGKTLALALIGAAAYSVIKLIDRVTE